MQLMKRENQIVGKLLRKPRLLLIFSTLLFLLFVLIDSRASATIGKSEQVAAAEAGLGELPKGGSISERLGIPSNADPFSSMSEGFQI